MESTSDPSEPSLEIGGGGVTQVQTKNSECEAEEETTHLSGLSLETGGDGNHFPRAAQPGKNKEIQV